MTCLVCGYDFRPGVIFWGIVGLGPFYKGVRMRWPRRKRASVICPECGWRNQVACEVSRDVIE